MTRLPDREITRYSALFLSLLFAPIPVHVGPTFRSGIAFAQSPPTADLRYEVVSIKKNTTGRLAGQDITERPDGGFAFINMTALNMLTLGFLGFGPNDMVGVPDWVMNDRYDISTVSPLARRATDQERATMIRG